MWRSGCGRRVRSVEEEVGKSRRRGRYGGDVLTGFMFAAGAVGGDAVQCRTKTPSQKTNQTEERKKVQSR